MAQQPKVAVVTGANKGIGLEVLQLAHPYIGAFPSQLMVARSTETYSRTCMRTQISRTLGRVPGIVCVMGCRNMQVFNFHLVLLESNASFLASFIPG